MIKIWRIFQQCENTVEIWKSFWSARDTWHVWIVFDTRDEVSWPGEVSRYHHLLSWSSSWYHWCSCSSPWYSQSVQLNLQNVLNFWAAKIRIRTESLNIQLHSSYSTFVQCFLRPRIKSSHPCHRSTRLCTPVLGNDNKTVLKSKPGAAWLKQLNQYFFPAS